VKRLWWLVGVFAIAALLGAAFFFTHRGATPPHRAATPLTPSATHFSMGQITDCGFNSKGAYATVQADTDEVWVDFLLDGRMFSYQGAYNARGTTTVLQVSFPRGHHVSGRKVYLYVEHRRVHHMNPTKFVTRKFAEAHQRRTTTEVVPDASHKLTCRFDYTDPD
jgi:hypothetical protein